MWKTPYFLLVNWNWKSKASSKVKSFIWTAILNIIKQTSPTNMPTVQTTLIMFKWHVCWFWRPGTTFSYTVLLHRIWGVCYLLFMRNAESVQRIWSNFQSASTKALEDAKRETVFGGVMFMHTCRKNGRIFSRKFFRPPLLCDKVLH